MSLTALALGATLRSTVLDPDFYRRALDKERAYQRIYDGTWWSRLPLCSAPSRCG